MNVFLKSLFNCILISVSKPLLLVYMYNASAWNLVFRLQWAKNKPYYKYYYKCFLFDHLVILLKIAFESQYIIILYFFHRCGHILPNCKICKILSFLFISFKSITYCDLQQLSLCCLSSIYIVGLWKAWKEKKQKDHFCTCCFGNTEPENLAFFEWIFSFTQTKRLL